MVCQVLADVMQMEPWSDSQSGQLGLVADARVKEDIWGANGSGRENDFLETDRRQCVQSC